MKALVRLTLVAAAALSAQAASAQTQFSASGDITGTVNAFRAALGAQNPNTAGSFGSGRREINWDGVPDGFSAFNNLPANFFNVNSPRGVVFSTPGSGFQVSGRAGIAPIEFDNILPGYSSSFATFSPQRLFTALGSNVVDVSFFIPGSTDAAFVTGFGSVFTDIDIGGLTSIQYFGAGGASLGTFLAPPGTAGSESLSFLGVLFNSPVVSRVRLTNGNVLLGGPDGTGFDVVVMDDFIYGEPVLAAVRSVPEPGAWALMIAGFGLTGAVLRRRSRAVARA